MRLGHSGPVDTKQLIQPARLRPPNPRRWPVTHLLSCNHDAVTYSDSHAGQLNFGFLWESRRRGSLQREGQRGAGPGQSPPQQSPQPFGHGSGVRHLQGHIQGVGNNVCRAVAFVVLEKSASTVGQLTAQMFASKDRSGQWSGKDDHGNSRCCDRTTPGTLKCRLSRDQFHHQWIHKLWDIFKTNKEGFHFIFI